MIASISATAWALRAARRAPWMALRITSETGVPSAASSSSAALVSTSARKLIWVVAWGCGPIAFSADGSSPLEVTGAAFARVRPWVVEAAARVCFEADVLVAAAAVVALFLGGFLVVAGSTALVMT